MSETPRNLEGYHQSMPTIGETGTNGRDYVIIGQHADWPVAPISLTIETVGTRDVAKETHDFMCRGWALADGTYDGFVKLENDEVEVVKIQITTVF
eukprot:CAMPEP_0178907046 /NCGR_PEP_ID=MMETSP0786-20121207/7152_1 /TAXON_ID=186022 /ORGANISM="Thalassionema frauenfeldii, Strain CCMP 1798" /LENGTH=95 /DNA_ID=CAMNT_0020578799 /DNA_START=12 /DNA_END=299 /DNA_ORIENTATION=+